MNRDAVLVRAPSRLHFGLFSFGVPDVRSFGGVGLMIDRPGLELVVRRCPSTTHATASYSIPDSVASNLCERAAKFADVALRGLLERGVFDFADDPRGPWTPNVELRAMPGEHQGLGTGTQLGLAIAAAVQALAIAKTGQPPKPPRDAAGLALLAEIVDRGLRSAIGTYGFGLGGLIVEAGKTPDETISPLTDHAAPPAEWRVLLVRPIAPAGLSGDAERAAFATLPPVPRAVTERLLAITRQELLPAAWAGAFETFTRAVHEFGMLAGACFAPAQGGVFAGPLLASIARWLIERGAAGVGQSSWGPTLFAFFRSQADAEAFLVENAFPPAWGGVSTLITAPSATGATLSFVE